MLNLDWSEKMSLKIEIGNMLDAADRDVLSDFFLSEVSDKNNEYCYEETREFITEIYSKEIKHKFVDSFGGEGQGDSFWSVYSFTKDDETVYVKFDGWYQSYNGAEYDSWFFVKPVQVTVTQYQND